MRPCIKNGQLLLLGLLLATAACTGKKRPFGEIDPLALREEDGGNADSVGMAPADVAELSTGDPETSDSMESVVAQGSGICDEAGNCRCDEGAESCEPTALCADGNSVCDATCPGCLIEGDCVESQALNPSNPCLICDPSRSSVNWSSNEGVACDDGLFCTTNDACGAGECTGAARACDDEVACNGVSTCDETADACTAPFSQCPTGQVCDATTDSCASTCDGCLINDVCFAAGSERAGDPCMVCDPIVSATAYTPAVGKACGASDAACSRADTCDAQGVCQPNHQSSGTACGDPGSRPCNQPDACDGNGTCAPRITANATPCDDGSFCTFGDQCQGGQCVSVGNRNCGTDQVCDEAADQCRCQGCVIGNRCVARGAVSATNPCQVCDPARSAAAFSPNVNALCGSGATECSGQDTCNAQGQCQVNDFPQGTSCSSVAEGQCQADGRCVDLLAGREPILLANIEAEGQGITINGVQTLDQVGTSLASGGDVNGDGIDDIVIGTVAARRSGQERLAYVVFGTGRPASISLAAVENGQGGFVITEASEDEALGRSVAMAGDINGDGLDDIVVSAPGVSSAANRSAAYVIFGKRSAAPVSVSAIASGQGGGFAINGATGSVLGSIVASAGDVNGDGLADIIVSVFGTQAGALIVFGKSSTSPVDSGALQSEGFAVLSGAESVSAVAGVGDVNGDGLDDLGLGAQGSGNADAGRAYVVFGKTLRTAVQLSAIQAGQPGGFVMNGARPGDGAGASISRAGDLNGDGLSDVVVGAPGAESNGNVAAGRAYVVFGRGNSTPLQLAAIEGATGNGFSMNGVASQDETGGAVTGIGDVNGDDIDDIIVGAKGAQSLAGVTYVVYGKAGPSPVSLVGLLSGGRGGFALRGVEAFDIAGHAVGNGDFDGDGLPDLLIGAPLTASSSSAGAVYVVLGRSFQ